MAEKAVVTGGAGFIGSHVADLLIERGLDVTVLDDLSTGSKENLNSKVTFIEGSICDPVSVKKAFQDSAYVFHLAAWPRIQPSFDQPYEHEDVNVIGTIRCMEALKGSRTLKKFVISSSSACYGNPVTFPTPETATISPLSPYALQKYSAEQYALLLGDRFEIPVVSLRYFNVYGPRSFNVKNPFNAYSSVVGIFAAQAKQNKPLTITGDGSQRRDFVHVTDVARANLAAAFSEAKNQVFNVGSGHAISIKDLALRFNKPFEFIAERKGEADLTHADINEITKTLGWSPKISLEQGIESLS